jgi:hypothetical protein
MLPPEGGTSQIGVLAASQETWPEVARSGRKPARQNRGGTPIDVRALLSARPCQQHGRLDKRLSAFHILSLISLVAYFLGLSEAGVSAQRKQGTTPSFPSQLVFAHRIVAAVAKLGR